LPDASGWASSDWDSMCSRVGTKLFVFDRVRFARVSGFSFVLSFKPRRMP
jgi:hypothetical protein